MISLCMNSSSSSSYRFSHFRLREKVSSPGLVFAGNINNLLVTLLLECFGHERIGRFESREVVRIVLGGMPPQK